MRNFAGKSVPVLLIIIIIGLSYTTVEARFGDYFEATLGSSAAPELIKQYGGVYIVPLQKRLWLDEVFRRLVEVTERQDVNYTLTVLASNEYNAFALPGGYVFLTKGLLDNIGDDEAKLAAVLGHELAHIEKKHGVTAVLRQMGLTILTEVGALWFDVLPPDVLRIASATLLQLLQLGWGREAEYEADLIGQKIAVQAGFDGIGAIALFDDLLELDSDDLPLKVFRTHPDTLQRRKRVEENLLTFWPEPQVADEEIGKKLAAGRSSGLNGRNDPKGRFLITEGDSRGVLVWDTQLEQEFVWLEDVEIKELAWSPDGNYLATLVNSVLGTELWFCNRYGAVIEKRRPIADLGRIKKIAWSPDGAMLALEMVKESSANIVVTYFATEVYLTVSRELGGTRPTWLGNRLYFSQSDQWYWLAIPHVEPVTLVNPVPQVLKREKTLSPTVIKEGNKVRLTRPSLILP